MRLSVQLASMAAGCPPAARPRLPKSLPKTSRKAAPGERRLAQRVDDAGRDRWRDGDQEGHGHEEDANEDREKDWGGWMDIWLSVDACRVPSRRHEVPPLVDETAAAGLTGTDDLRPGRVAPVVTPASGLTES